MNECTPHRRQSREGLLSSGRAHSPFRGAALALLALTCLWGQPGGVRAEAPAPVPATFPIAKVTGPEPAKAAQAAAPDDKRQRALAEGFSPLTPFPAEVDPSEFYPVSKVRPGMRGKGRTVFTGTKLDEFEFVVLGVNHNATAAGSDLIWVRLVTPKLKDIGVVAGMSGSPVYIEGRMLGAVAYGFGLSKEPIAGITPIEQMLRVYDLTNADPHPAGAGTTTTNWNDMRRAMLGGDPGENTAFVPGLVGGGPTSQRFRVTREAARTLGLPGADAVPAEGLDLEPLATPLMLSTSNPQVLRLAEQFFGRRGFTIASTPGRGPAVPVASAGASAGAHPGVPTVEGDTAAIGDRVLKSQERMYPEKPSLVDGSAIAVTLMNGDLDMSAIGTVTLARGNRLVAFGHPMFGDGAVDMPMANAYMFDVMPSIARPFKLGEAHEIYGAVRQDRLPAIGGQIGVATPMFPMTVKVSAPEIGAERTFRYRVLPDRGYAPMLAAIGFLDAFGSVDRLGGYQTLETLTRVELANGRVLERADFRSAEGMATMATAMPLYDIVGELLNNQFSTMQIRSVSVEATIRQKLELLHLTHATADRPAYRPGETVRILIHTEHWRSEPKQIPAEFKLPDDLRDGTYRLRVCDGTVRMRIEGELRPWLGRPHNLDQLIDSLEISHPSNRVYLSLLDAQAGMAINGTPLPDLPDSVASALNSTTPSYQKTSLSARLIREQFLSLPSEIMGNGMISIRVDRKLPAD